MKSKELLRALKKDGWQIERIKGSHYVLKKNARVIILPMHNREMPKGLAEDILKRAGIK